MKKLTIPLLLVFAFFLFPINTFAKTDVSPYWTGYKNRSNDWSRPHNISSGFDTGLSDCNGLARWQGCSIPAADTNLRQFYAITGADICFTNTVIANKVYNIELQWWGSYGNYSTDANWYVGFNDYSWSPNGAITHTGHEFTRNNDNHYRGTTTYTFVPNNNYNNWCISIGGGNYDDRVLWLNRADESQGILLAYAYLDENTGTDGALLEQQIQTNQNLNNINNTQQQTNNKIDETNNKLDETNEELGGINDTLNSANAPNANDIEDFKGNLPVLSFGPISGALQIPIQYLNYWHSQFEQHTCTPINFGSLLGTNLTLPCINPVDDYLTSNTTMGGLGSFISIVCCLFIYYNTALLIVHAWDTWTSFADDFTGLYRPNSSVPYEPKHAKGGGN